ncbi:MAG: transglutaminase-like domain-containing protein [Pirellulaceae bacterium]
MALRGLISWRGRAQADGACAMHAASRESRELVQEGRWVLFAMATLAAAMTTALRSQGSELWGWLVAELVVVGTILLGLRWRSTAKGGSSADSLGTTSGWAGWVDHLLLRSIALPSALVVWPLLSRIIQRQWMGLQGEALELCWIAMLQMGAWWLAAKACSLRERSLALVANSFLVLFVLATSENRWSLALAAVYGILVAWWMMSSYWDRIAKGFVAHETIPLVRLRVAALALLLGLLAPIGWIVSRSPISPRTLDGFLPTSGGRQGGDPSARRGVGDGDQLVGATQEATTFGPVESELFLESQMPSLYDVASEIYGEAIPKVRRYQRAVALQSEVRETEREGSESRKSGREFSALRTARRQPPGEPLAGTSSRAVCYLIGRTPIHLRLDTLERFDGLDWRSELPGEAGGAGEPKRLETRAGKPWVVLEDLHQQLFHPMADRLAIKVIGLQSARLLSPANLEAVHIDRIDRLDFFGRDAAGQWRMVDRDQVPQLTVLHEMVRIPSLHEARLGAPGWAGVAIDPKSAEASGLSSMLEVPGGGERYRLWMRRQLGEAWEGWSEFRKLETAVEWLKSHGRLERGREWEGDLEDVAWRFLEDPRGDDYHFATAAAMMARSLNIPARLAQGFYARPERYDRRAGQTHVLREDLHTWPEILVQGRWIPIEPTPGYARPQEHRTWGQWLAEMGWRASRWIGEHRGSIAVSVLATGLAVWTRRIWIDFLASCLLWLMGTGSTRWRLASTVRLMALRAWLENAPRTASTPLARWLADQLERRSPLLDRSQRELFTEAVDRFHYAPPSRLGEWLQESAEPLESICRTIFFSPIKHAKG